MSEPIIGGGMTFSCPMCGEIVKTPPASINPSPAVQLQYSVLSLQRHLLQQHPRTKEVFQQLIGQYSAALTLKAFQSSDASVAEPREQLYKACIDTILQDWQINAEAPQTGSEPSKPVPVVR